MSNRISIIAIASLMACVSASGREIKGTVIDGNDTPLEFVNVALYSDSTFVGGNITGSDGAFAIQTDIDGGLTVKMSFIGYDTYKAKVPESGDIGVVRLKLADRTLDEVVVKGHRASTRIKGNALVTDVEGTPLAIAGTAKDLLAQVPMVVDNGGTLEVFGKGAPVIYINGRKVNDKQELVQLNSHDIKNVEVITNPGAAFAADVKSVIRIRTKPPKGDGWSGTLRIDNGFQHYFRTGNSIDLKYRTRSLELFANYGWWYGHNLFDRSNDMLTTASIGTYNQLIRTVGKELYNDMTGKIGFSWMINDRHSVGAYYQNSWNRHTIDGSIPSEVWQNDRLLDRYATSAHQKSTALPRHCANMYYNGSMGKLDVDFNADLLWYKNREAALNEEVSEVGAERIVNTFSANRSRMFAEKLVVSHPLWKGGIEIGEEYTNSRNTNRFTVNIAEIGNADNRVDESNIAAFVEIGQQFGRFNIGIGVRYEHVKFDYYEMGRRRDEQSRSYNNLFPSVNIATQMGSVQMGLSYSGKTMRPRYDQLDGSISYINRFTYETGNPYLKPTKMQTIEYMARWRRLFAQISYTYYKDGTYFITEPYGANSEATIFKTANLPHRHYLSAFAGGQFQVGIWQPKVNAGMMKQWLTLPVNGSPVKMNTPMFLIQWQNALHLPLDIWLNADAQLMTRGWDNNTRLTNTPWYVNAKLYKAFFHNSFSITLEAKDLFDSARKDVLLSNDAVQIAQRDLSPGRSVMLTLQYRFNTTRSRYRGTGAGSTERTRF